MRFWVLLLLVPLGACSYTTYLSNADENGGTVNMVTDFNHDGAVDKAKEHCAQYHREARIADEDRQSNTLSFVCQARDLTG
jgi:hypothetical protein